MKLLKLEKRKPLTALQRAKMFRDHDGICCICKQPIGVKDIWLDEHIKPLGMGGTNDMSNRGPAHIDCAKAKTKDDKGQIAKAKRREAKHIGAKQPKQTIKTRSFAKAEPHVGNKGHAAHKAAMAAKGKNILPRRLG
jgi:5-methylcytosine-specific restriction enzyme A